MIRQALLTQQEDRTEKDTTIPKQFGKGRRSRFSLSARCMENLGFPSRFLITGKSSLAVAESAIILRQEKSNAQPVKKIHLTQAIALGFAKTASLELSLIAKKQRQKKRGIAKGADAFW